MSTWQGPHGRILLPDSHLSSPEPRVAHFTTYPNVCVSFVHSHQLKGTRNLETCVTPPCPSSWSKVQYSYAWANQPSKRNTIHVWYKSILRMIPDGKANGMASEASHFYQILGIRSQASLTSTLHAQV